MHRGRQQMRPVSIQEEPPQHWIGRKLQRLVDPLTTKRFNAADQRHHGIRPGSGDLHEVENRVFVPQSLQFPHPTEELAEAVIRSPVRKSQDIALPGDQFVGGH